MAGTLLTTPLWALMDANGDPISNGKAYFYLTGTTTPATVYTTRNLLGATHASPVVADSAGRFDPIYLDPDVQYKVVIKDAAGSTIETIDPLNEIPPEDETGAPGVTYISDLAGVLSGLNLSVTALTAAISTVSADPQVIEFGPETYVMSAAGLVAKHKVPLKGQGMEMTTLDWSALAAFATSGLITATGTGPGTWLPVSGSLTKGRTAVTVSSGDVSTFTARKHVMVRSTEFGPPQINDVAKFTWVATTSIAQGELTYANGNWYICTTGGTTGATSPTSTSNPVTDGTATLYYIDYGNIQNQILWTASLSATLGMFRVTSTGKILICCVAGTTGSSQPSFTSSNSLQVIDDGSAKWRYAGYYNSTKGELKPYAVDRVSGSTIYLTQPLEDDYPASYTGVSFTVQIAPVDLSEITISDMTIKGRGIPAAGSLSAVGSGTALYYESSELCDKGVVAKWCILRFKRVRFQDIEQFAVHAAGCLTYTEECEFLFSPTHLDSQQYGVFVQGGGRHISTSDRSFNARHLTDGDGSASTSEAAYRGIPSPIVIDNHDATGCWQSVGGSHRAARLVIANGGVWDVLTAGWKPRCAQSLLTGTLIRGPRYASVNDYIAQDGLVSFYYQGGKGVVKGVRTEGGVYGLRVSNSDGIISDLDIDMQIEGANQYGARFGVADGDRMENIVARLAVSATVNYESVLVDGPMTNCHIALRYDGGRKGISSANRKPKLTNCTFDVSGTDCTEEAVDLYNWTGGRLAGGVRQSSTTNVINRIKDAQAVTIDRATSIGPAAFAGEFWKIQATSLSSSAYINMDEQVCYSPSGVGGTGLTVEANVSFSNFARINTPHTIKISAGANATNTYADAPSHTQDASYTFTAADHGRTVLHTSGSAHTWTVPASGAVPVGWFCTVANSGAGAVTIAKNSLTLQIAGSGSASADKTLAQHGVARLTCIGAGIYKIEETTGVT